MSKFWEVCWQCIFIILLIVTIIIWGMVIFQKTENIRMFGKYQMVNNVDVENQAYIDEANEALKNMPPVVIEKMEKKKCRVILLKGHCNHDYYVESNICNDERINNYIYELKEGKSSSVALGFYAGARKLAYVFTEEADNSIKSSVAHTTYHEIGHFIWDEILNESDRERITEALENGEQSDFVSATRIEYAGTSIEECFCDVFSSYYGHEYDEEWEHGLCDGVIEIMISVLGERK